MERESRLGSSGSGVKESSGKVRRITHQDIARHVGVSQATVSKVLSNRENSIGISPKTRKAVIEAAVELGYNKDKVASSMVHLVERSVAILCEHIANPFASVMMRGMEDELSETKYQYLFASSNGHPARSMALIQSLTRRFTTGFILNPFYESNTSQAVHNFLLKRGVPFVQTGYHSLEEENKAPLITTNNREIFKELTQHLIKVGHRRIAFLYTTPHYSSIAARLRGFREAMEEAAIDVDEGLIVDLPRHLYFDVEEKRRLLSEWFVGKNRPTAIMTVKDDCAMQLIRLIESTGLRVPDDIAVTGCDDYYHFIPKYYPDTYFRLTTVRQNLPEIGKGAVRTLLELIELDNPPIKCGEVIIPARIIIRGSCGSEERTEPFTDQSLQLRGLGVGYLYH